MEPSNEIEKWARATLRKLLLRLTRQAASELLREGLALTQAAERCRRWK